MRWQKRVSVFVSVGVTRLGPSCPALARPVIDEKLVTPEVVCFEYCETHSQRGGRGFESPLVHQIPKDLTRFSKLDELSKLSNWPSGKVETHSDLLGPFQAPLTLPKQFFIAFRHVRSGMSRPGVL